MENRFVFQPVGQGLFYTGSLSGGRYRFVYDCGTASSQRFLTDALDRFLPSGRRETVDLVVISHMHADHMSGLADLFSRAYVKKLVLPYLGPDGPVRDFLLMHASLVRSRRRVVFRPALYERLRALYAGEQTRDEVGEVVIVGGDGETDERGNIFFRTSSIETDIPDWRFLFLNHSIGAKRYSRLAAAISNTLRDPRTALTRCPAAAAAQLKQVYRSVFGSGQNVTSVVLIHSPLVYTAGYSGISLSRYGGEPLSPRYGSGTVFSVLTGDAEADMRMRNAIGAVSFGAPNRYGHPSTDVCNEIFHQYHKPLFLCTQHLTAAYAIYT